ncbi:MAG: hypothetical protein JW947_01715 [Sedimentisphaerales bacterium]|nr:hypothetical protein [Sedimentisphaerales bacterium]
MPTEMLEINRNFAQPTHVEELSGLPVDTGVLFSDHRGRYKKRIERRQRKMIEKLGFLPPFLEHGEKILYVTTGCSPISFIEQLLKGALLYYLKRSIFVFTDRRILHIPVKGGLTYRYSIAQILYTDCMRLRLRFSTLIARYRSGRSEKFPCIRCLDRKKVKFLLRDMSLKGRGSDALERTHLCPRCTHPLIMNYYACPNCSLEFKSRSRARTLSILFPGGGYFYTRHPLLGLLRVFMESVFALLLVAVIVTLFMTPLDQQQRLKQAILVCALVLAFEKSMAVLHANKFVDEFIPTERHVQVLVKEADQYHSSPRPEDLLCSGWRSR